MLAGVGAVKAAHEKSVFKVEGKKSSLSNPPENMPLLSWFNPSQQLSTTQLLTHFPSPSGMGEKTGKRSKTRGLR